MLSFRNLFVLGEHGVEQYHIREEECIAVLLASVKTGPLRMRKPVLPILGLECSGKNAKEGSQFHYHRRGKT